jgi:hypothetical protein
MKLLYSSCFLKIGFLSTEIRELEILESRWLMSASEKLPTDSVDNFVDKEARETNIEGKIIR